MTDRADDAVRPWRFDRLGSKGYKPTGEGIALFFQCIALFQSGIVISNASHSQCNNR